MKNSSRGNSNNNNNNNHNPSPPGSAQPPSSSPPPAPGRALAWTCSSDPCSFNSSIHQHQHQHPSEHQHQQRHDHHRYRYCYRYPGTSVVVIAKPGRGTTPHKRRRGTDNRGQWRPQRCPEKHQKKTKKISIAPDDQGACLVFRRLVPKSTKEDKEG